MSGTIHIPSLLVLQNPEPVLKRPRAQLEAYVQDSDQTRKQVARLEGLLAQKAAEQGRVVGLARPAD